jgi:hypothetical protein
MTGDLTARVEQDGGESRCYTCAYELPHGPFHDDGTEAHSHSQQWKAGGRYASPGHTEPTPEATQ